MPGAYLQVVAFVGSETRVSLEGMNVYITFHLFIFLRAQKVFHFHHTPWHIQNSFIFLHVNIRPVFTIFTRRRFLYRTECIVDT